MAEGARLESVYTFTGIVGSNPTLSAVLDAFLPISGQFLYPKIAGIDLWICMGASKSYAGCWTLVSGS